MRDNPQPTPEQARNIGRTFLAMAETFRESGIEHLARRVATQAQALLTGAPRSAEERPELTALLRIEYGQKAIPNASGVSRRC